MKESETRLPKGWNRELLALDQEISQRNAQMNTLDAEMKEEIERVREPYLDRIRQINPIHLSGLKAEAWQRIRDEYPITHPRIVEKFNNARQAAEVLIHYWQGEEIDHEELWKGIAGYGDNRLNPRAFDFARNLTQPDSPERDYVERVQVFLWEGYTK